MTSLVAAPSSSHDAGRAKKARRLGVSSTSAGSSEDTHDGHTVGATCTVQGLTLTDHTFEVPLDHTGATGGTLSVFVREVVATSRVGDGTKLPVLLYLQGGPGFESPRPVESGGWIGAAVDKFRVLLLDQRGTGLSTPVTAAAVAARGGAEEQAAYLQHFRADSIVRDAELIRRRLLGEDVKWTTLGQSFGGFCTLTYLSLAPHGLEASLITGGLSPVVPGCSADTVYTALFARVRTQNGKFYARFPHDEQRVRDVVQAITAAGGAVTLPGGGRLTARGLQALGINLGFAGGMEALHFLFEGALDGRGGLSHAFLRQYENMMSVDTNPIYAILHESIYCQGAASQWAAQRALEQQGSDFDAAAAAAAGRPVLLTGEMIFPWMFDDIASLRPLKAAAELLAAKQDWPALYDESVLRTNTVPVVAAAYYEDMYVDFRLSEQTAATVKGLRMWVTSEYLHSGIREDGPRILNHMLAMVDDVAPLR